MRFRKVTAIIRSQALETVERALQDLGVKGVTASQVKGYGEYANFFSRDWLVTHTKIEIFTTEEQAGAVAATITDAAHTGRSGDGIVAIAPVEEVLRVRTRSPAGSDEI